MHATVYFRHGLAVGAYLAIDAIITGPVEEHTETNGDFRRVGAGIGRRVSDSFLCHLIHP
jgi:hypothetical protein